jgi:hypothetical protein
MITILIQPDNGEPYRVLADSRDVRLWERIGPRNTMLKLVQNPSMDDQYSLAHIAIKRQRLRDVPPLEEFIETNAVQTINEHNEVLDAEELELVIEKELINPMVTARQVADAVIGLLDRVRMRAVEPNPTR